VVAFIPEWTVQKALGGRSLWSLMAAAVRSGTGAEGWLRSSAANWALWEVATGQPWDQVGGRRRGCTEWVAGRFLLMGGLFRRSSRRVRDVSVA
jgi:hypothetical protein